MQDSEKELSKIDFRFHFFPWWNCPDYVLDRSVAITPEMAQYFQLLKEQDIQLTSAQKQWYIAKQSVQQGDMKREYPSTPTESFETSAEGVYYAQQLSRARQEGRLSRIPYDAELPVHTAWDLGFGDSTAIWFFQIVGKEIHLLKYHEDCHQPLTHYLKLIKSKDYSYGKHLAPHDIAAHEYSTGHSRQELAARHGIHFMKVPDIGVDEGIDATRLILNRCWFDETSCEKGIRALDVYRRQWNDKQGCWGAKPLHNAASHGADAFRMLAVGLNLITGLDDMNDSKAEKLRREAFGFPDRSGLEESHPLYTGYG